MPLEAPLQYQTVAKSLGCNWAFSPFSWQHSAPLRRRLTEEWLWQESSIICGLSYKDNLGDGFGLGFFGGGGLSSFPIIILFNLWEAVGIPAGLVPWDLHCKYRAWNSLHNLILVTVLRLSSMSWGTHLHLCYTGRCIWQTPVLSSALDEEQQRQ